MVPGKINLAGPGTKPDIQLTTTLHLLSGSRFLSMKFQDAVI